MIHRVYLWLRALLLRDRFEREMQEEMADHLERSIQRLVVRGMSRDEARREALREFGNVAYIQEEGRRARRSVPISVSELRFGVSRRWHPRAIGVACAIGSTALGVAHMAAAGAPGLYLAVNPLALVMGLAFVALAGTATRSPHLPDAVVVLLGGALLATALFGVSVEGASRWIRIGGLSIQMSLVLVPAMLVSFAQRRNMLTAAGISIAAVALALQPDRAMAGVMASSLAVLALLRADRWVLSTLSLAVGGWAVTLLRSDALPAAPFIDRILFTSFSVHWLAGLGVLTGAALLVFPAIAGRRMEPENAGVYVVFGMTWFGMVLAAAIGSSPTPLVGYGGGAVLGYALSLSVLPRKATATAGGRVQAGVALPVRSGTSEELRIALTL